MLIPGHLLAEQLVYNMKIRARERSWRNLSCVLLPT
jgi:hypothetical protein